MEDSETVVAQTPAIMGYTSASDTSTDCGDVSTNAAPDASAYTVGATGDLATPAASVDLAACTDSSDVVNAVCHDSNLGAGDAYNTDPNSTKDEASTTTTYGTSENLVDLTSTPMDSSQVPANDSSVNGNNISEARNNAYDVISENGTASDYVHGSASAHQPVDDSAFSAEGKLWSIVRANSLDFNAWTALIEETEKVAEGNILKIRKVYDSFLAEFPLCYGYWKKYADHEAHMGYIDKVVEVYERAVQGVTYSVDMWFHYCVFVISTYGGPDTIRRLFERGLAYVGTDYLSFPLWDKYIEYEYTQQEWSHLAMIYTRILENPNQQLDRYFDSFKKLVASRPLSELRTAEEAAAAAGALEAGGQEIEGEVHPNAVEQSSKPESVGLKEAYELEKYIIIREELYKKAKELDAKIIGFETAIERPYFHVRPLNVAELENWRNYLDFIEGGDDFNKLNSICRIICFIG